MNRARIGAVGAGWWATSNHFPIFAAREDVELVGVCGLGDLGSVKEQFGFGLATGSVDELLDAGLDGLVVTTPHDLHFEVAAKALDRGIHVLVEKPMTLHAEQAWELVERAERAGVHVLVPYGWNYKPFTVEAKRLLDEVGIGDIQYALCHMASPTRGLFGGDPTHMLERWSSDTAPTADTWSSPARGGGYAHGQITHSSALLFWLTGLRAATVSGLTRNSGSPVDLYDSGAVRFDSGAIGTVSGAATVVDGDPYQVDIRLFGTEGTLMLDVERERVALHRDDGTRIDLTIEPGAGEYECLEPPARFIDLVTGARDDNNSPADVAARSVELVEALLRSAADGGRETRVHD